MTSPRPPLITRAHARWILGQVVLVAVMAFIYFRVRGLTEGSPHVAVAHAHRVMALERDLGINVESGLQRALAPSATLTTLANWVYIWGHWPVIIVTMLWLAWRHQAIYLRLRNGMVFSGAVGMIVFAAYPVAPPRLGGFGLVDTVTERSKSYRLLQPPAFLNQYAALPSLHAGWDLLVGIAIVTAASTLALRLVGYLMPILMALAVVVTANHYILDVVAGLSLALSGHFVALGVERVRSRREQSGRAGSSDAGQPVADPRPREQVWPS